MQYNMINLTAEKPCVDERNVKSNKRDESVIFETTVFSDARVIFLTLVEGE